MYTLFYQPLAKLTLNNTDILTLNRIDISNSTAQNSALAFIFALGTAILVFFMLVLYIYTAWAWMSTAKKLKYKKAWLAWIPIANLFLIPILAKKKWTWGFMFLVPIANIVFWFIWTWKIFERRKLYGFYSLVLLIPGVGPLLYLISLGFLAWRK